MGSTVKWVFCALFDTISIAKLFHSFEYRKIPPNDSSWRCPLYRSTISKSWIQLLSVSIFQLPNKSPSFRLCHSANEKLLNVYVPHLSINSDSRNCTTNNRFKRSRIFDSKTKIKFHSRTANTWCDYFPKMNRQNWECSPCTFSGVDHEDSQTFGRPHYSRNHWCRILLFHTHKCFVFIPGFIRRVYNSGNECNWTNTKQLVFTKPCPQKGFMKTWKCVF